MKMVIDGFDIEGAMERLEGKLYSIGELLEFYDRGQYKFTEGFMTGIAYIIENLSGDVGFILNKMKSEPQLPENQTIGA